MRARSVVVMKYFLGSVRPKLTHALEGYVRRDHDHQEPIVASPSDSHRPTYRPPPCYTCSSRPQHVHLSVPRFDARDTKVILCVGFFPQILTNYCIFKPFSIWIT